MTETQARDRLDGPAVSTPCDRCSTPALLRPGGLCASCIAVIGLASDRTDYEAWRQRVSEQVAAGPGAS